RTDWPVGRVELRVDDGALSAEPAPVLAILTVAFDRELLPDAVRLAQLEVVLAVVRRHVHEAGSAVGGDEVARQERARLGEEPAEVMHRMAGYGAGEVRTQIIAESVLAEIRGRASGALVGQGTKTGSLAEVLQQVRRDQI